MNGAPTLWDGLRAELPGLRIGQRRPGFDHHPPGPRNQRADPRRQKPSSRPGTVICTCISEARRIEKEYLALVWGWPENDSFVVDAPILRQGDREPSPIYLKQAVHPDGAAARTLVPGRDLLYPRNDQWLPLCSHPRLPRNRSDAPNSRPSGPRRPPGRRRQNLRSRPRLLSGIHIRTGWTPELALPAPAPRGTPCIPPSCVFPTPVWSGSPHCAGDLRAWAGLSVVPERTPLLLSTPH